MPQNIPFLTVFLSSPGDVAEERILARKIMKRLPNRYVFKGRVGLNVVAWDDPESTTAMEATLTPQAAINKGLPMPSESDIVIVIFWSRMGTPFTDDNDGQLYQSGTHWELLDALKSRTTKTYIYRRMFEPDFGSINAPDYDTRVEQYRRVKRFFDSEMFYKEDGQIKRGVHQYGTPSDFEEIFERQFEQIVAEILADLEKAGHQKSIPQPLDPPPSQPQIEVIETEVWDDSRSPFPGLRSFTEADADIFFGRSRETDALVQQIKHSRFVAVVGASGSGKSSLTAAGLIPRLRANALPGSKDWFVVTFKPGERPFEALAAALIETIPALAVDNPRKYAQELDEFATSLQEKPDRLAKTLHHALKNAKDWSEVLLFVDQFEELLTLAPENQRKQFAEMLAYSALNANSRVRVVLTMRADFYHRMLPLFEEELRNGSFTLSVPKRDALRQMIERPAERAGVTLEDGLVERILDDTGDEPGALALMAYLLDELYNLDADKNLTHAEYDQLGGVAKAIGTRAENIFKSLPGDETEKEQILWRVFRELVEVDENGTATRRRVSFDTDDEAVRIMIYAFADARLLTTDASTSHPVGTAFLPSAAKQEFVEVAHEALLREWDRLANWILQKQDDLRLIRQFERDAEQWKQRRMPEDLQPKHEQMVYFEDALQRLDMHRNLLPSLLQKYTEPEQNRLLAKINIVQTSHQERSRIGERLAEIGDPRKGIGLREDRLPDIEWLPVEGGEIEIELDKNKIEKFTVEPFYMAKYLVTYQQFQAFVDAPDGYQDKQWWLDFPEDYQRQKLRNQLAQYNNYPRDTISWYQAVAFSNWLTHRLQGTQLPNLSTDNIEPWIIGQNAIIRLPLEWEWQWAAQSYIEKREYPWGDWLDGYANTLESGLGDRSTAVGMYPQGSAKIGMLDMAGNLWEWCLNDYENIRAVDYINKQDKVLRGGAFNHFQYFARASSRYSYNSRNDSRNDGIRLAVSLFVSDLR
jgi:formylglycine-generating enzyme required for sulfatase activity